MRAMRYAFRSLVGRKSFMRLRGFQYCTGVSEGTEQQQKDPLPVFMQDEVQSILKNMTGFDLMKVAGPQKALSASKPRYKLLTDQELEQMQEEAKKRVRYRLQMPPFMKSRDPVKEVLAENPELEGLEGSKIIFTDITFGVKNRQRIIVVRDPDGTLRKAEWEERDRVNQVYSPVEGRELEAPGMFEEEALERLLVEEQFAYILDMASVQFEPDDPEYIRVTHRTYEVIDSKHRYDDLRSTRHFGPMAFYFVWYKKIDHLLIDMIYREMFSDAHDLVKLYCIVHPNSPIAEELAREQTDDVLAILKMFANVEATHKGRLELAIQAVEEKRRSMTGQTPPHT